MRVLSGFSTGSIAGLFVGTVMGWREVINKALNPIISLLYPIPALDWLPLLMLWLGIGEALPITIIFICSFFPVLYNTVTGIKSVDTNYVQVTAIYVTHDLIEAEEMADRIAIINSGRIEQVSSPKEVFFYPKSEKVSLPCLLWIGF